MIFCLHLGLYTLYYFTIQNENAQSSTQDDEILENKMNNSEDESMEQEEDGNGEGEGKGKGQDATSRQNEKLYSAEGILNTKMRRAEKKQRKKVNKSSVSTDAMEDDDYDFKVDFKKK